MNRALFNTVSAWDSLRERLWLCRLRGKHQEKFGSHGRCYRCGKAMR